MRAINFSWVRWCVSVLVLLHAGASYAGRECTAHTPQPNTVSQAFAMGERLTQLLDREQARVAIVARVGSDQSRRGVRYTHVAFAQRDHAKGRWTVTHMLNHCGEESAEIYDEGLANFFLDDLFVMEARVIVPSESLQTRLLETIRSPLKRELFEPRYSLIANPWEIRFQNSNNWAIELIAAASAPRGEVNNRRSAQQWLRSTGYQPTKIAIGAGERAGTRLFAANIRYSDHPDSAWQTQRYEVATGDSVMRYVERIDANAAIYVIEHRKAPTLVRASARPVEALQAQAPMNPLISVAPSATATTPATSSREQVLNGTRALVMAYACRDAGYLRQCQELNASSCESLVRTAVSECFAPVSDRELIDAERNTALGMVERIGLCAVANVDASLGVRQKRTFSASGDSCADFRRYQAVGR